VRGTQSLLSICAECWKRPSLLGWELLWRWTFGILAVGFAAYLLWPLVNQASAELGGLSLTDPVQAGTQIATVAAGLKPQADRVALWLAPVLALLWAVASGLGRTAVLRRMDPALRPVPVALILLQLLRVAVLLGAFFAWYGALQWAAGVMLDANPPNIVGWCAFVICLSLAVFVLWALVSWIFSIAPLLAMLEGQGVFPSLARSFRQGPLTGKLVEVNLVLGIVRLALIVVAMVFSAIPLPFITNPNGTALYLWWALGAVLYLAAGNFFQVVRLAACVKFWRFYHPDPMR
jgi:hypothetical protein